MGDLSSRNGCGCGCDNNCGCSCGGSNNGLFGGSGCGCLILILLLFTCCGNGFGGNGCGGCNMYPEVEAAGATLLVAVTATQKAYVPSLGY